jgi:PilZ domain
MNRTPGVPRTTRTAEDAATPKERRRHQRHAAEQQVQICWQSKSGLPRESEATLRNVSAGGFAVELDESFPVDAMVVVKASERWLQCAVRHVQQNSDSYLIGLEVLAASDGSTLARSLEGLSSALSDSVSE